MIVFLGVSVLMSVVLSFTKYNILTPPQFNELDNYTRMLTDKKFVKALMNTLKVMVYIVPPSDCDFPSGVCGHCFEAQYLAWKIGEYCDLYSGVVFKCGGGYCLESNFKWNILKWWKSFLLFLALIVRCFWEMQILRF